MLLRRLAALWPYALVAFLYLATSPFFAQINNPNEMVRVYASRAYVESHRFVINQVERDWGYVNDKAIRDGELYSGKAPLQTLIGIPIYAIAPKLLAALDLPQEKRQLVMVLRLFGSTSIAILFAFALLRWVKTRGDELGLPPGVSTSLGLAITLGTMLYPYGLLFTGHNLAAACAFGSILALMTAVRLTPHTQNAAVNDATEDAPGPVSLTPPGLMPAGWLLLAGFLAGATPFAEYPAALVALPGVLAGIYLSKGQRLQTLGLLTLGGAPTFGLGLWAHLEMWGSPFKTGYSFLANPAYKDLVTPGFFGVELPVFSRLLEALGSLNTGLFVFSPFLLVGLIGLILTLLGRNDRPRPGDRAFAAAGLTGVLLSFLFVASYEGWHGGWTLGPRYIISLAPLLGIYTLETLTRPLMRMVTAPLAAAAVLITGLSGAIYPHLSTEYVHPVKSFVVATYLKGLSVYGIGEAFFGLHGWAANLVHGLPLVFVAVYCLAKSPKWQLSSALLAASLGIFLAWPEAKPEAAQRENQRLWERWEPLR